MSGLIDRGCNSSTGHEVDTLLRETLVGALSLFNIRNAREKTASPPIRYRREGREWVWRPGENRTTLARPHMEVVDGRRRALLPVGDEKLKRQQERGMRRHLVGETPEGYELTFTYSHETEEGHGVPIQIHLFGAQAGPARGVAKIALMAAAHAYGSVLVLRPACDPARAFVLGKGPSVVTAHPTGSAAYRRALGLHAPRHAVVLEPAHDRLMAAVVLFGTFTYHVDLGPLGGLELSRWARQFDPEQHTVEELAAPPLPVGGTDEEEIREAVTRWGWAVAQQSAIHFIGWHLAREGVEGHPMLDPRFPQVLVENLARMGLIAAD